MELNNYYNSSRKGQGFPVQMVLYTILGLVLLSMGFFLTNTIFQSGDDFSQDLSNQLRTNINERYCDGSSYLCSPVITLRGSGSDVSTINAVNLGPENEEFTLHINSHSDSRDQLNSSCGTLLFDYYDLSVEIDSRTSAQIPIAFSKENINQRPCSFTTTMYLENSVGDEVENSRTPLTIRIE
ncbi:MAG: hypothetical protein ACLFPL_02340 [Candidatus Nanoarchaeia archaeon]